MLLFVAGTAFGWILPKGWDEPGRGAAGDDRHHGPGGHDHDHR